MNITACLRSFSFVVFSLKGNSWSFDEHPVCLCVFTDTCSLGLGLKVIDGVSYAVPDDQSGKKHGHTSDTETAGDPCVYGNDESVHQSEQISIHSLPNHSDMASLLHTHTHTAVF